MNMCELLHMHIHSILPVLAWSHIRKDRSPTFLQPLTIFVRQLKRWSHEGYDRLRRVATSYRK